MTKCIKKISLFLFPSTHCRKSVSCLTHIEKMRNRKIQVKSALPALAGRGEICVSSEESSNISKRDRSHPALAGWGRSGFRALNAVFSRILEPCAFLTPSFSKKDGKEKFLDFSNQRGAFPSVPNAVRSGGLVLFVFRLRSIQS